MVITPTKEQIETSSIAIKNKEKFHFFTSTLSIGLSSGDLNFQETVKQRLQKILSILFGIADADAPTYNLSDKGVGKNDGNIHAGPITIETSKTMKKRRFGRRHY